MQKIKCMQLEKHQLDQLKRLIDADMKVNELISLCKRRIKENTSDWDRKEWASAIKDLIGRTTVGKNLEYTICIIQRAAAQMFSIYKA